MKKVVFLMIFVGLFGFALMAHAKEPKGKKVKVINGPSSPVLVQGNVNVTNTPDVNVVNEPTVQAEQIGEWDVGINMEVFGLSRIVRNSGWSSKIHYCSGSRLPAAMMVPAEAAPTAVICLP